ncbi:GNAT family N-acetyltransferase [Ilumatobacter sp.]|uniref:GNAT family N-acetyltransferase n=1 Tax=Ilumatobacter sp. TaxID=1967498 RepID=UPI003B52D0ED
MQLYVRDALETDVDQLVDLLLGGRVTDTPDDVHHLADHVDAIREIDRTDGSYLLVGELAGRIVAMLQLITFRHLQHRGGRCAEIESMHVTADDRSSGVGSQMIDHAIARAKDLGCYRIQLTSRIERRDAHRFYEAHEFRPSHVGFKRALDLDWTPGRSAGRRPLSVAPTR